MFKTSGFLSKDVTTPTTSIGQYLRSNFPNLKPIQAEYKSKAGDLVIDSMGANAANVGTAVDLIIRLVLEPDETPASALALYPFNSNYHQVVHQLAALVGRAGDPGLEARAAWALGLCVSAHRAGAAWAPFVPDLVQSGSFNVDTMLEQADDEAVAELIALRELAERRLTSKLSGPFSLGPTFDLSKMGPARRIAAEADLIADGLLIDVKTTLAPINSAGLRQDALKPSNVYQLLAYVLMDYSNQYNIDRVGIYSARYGTLTEWPLERFTSVAAGTNFDLGAARQHFWDMMQEDVA